MNSGKGDETSTPTLGSSGTSGNGGNRRGLWALGGIAVIATCGAIAVLLALRPPVDGEADETDAETATAQVGHTQATDSETKSLAQSGGSEPDGPRVPLFDTTNMQLEVRDRLLRARAALMRHLDSSEAWGQLGAVCDAHGLYECAESCYRQAHGLAPDEFRFVYLLAIVLDALGRSPDEVVSLYMHAARLEPDYPQVYHRIGEALSEQGKLDEARDSYLKAVELDPDFAVGHRSLGQTALAKGDPQIAVEHLQRALELTPEDGMIHATLARAYTALGDRKRGEEAARKSRSLDHPYNIPDPLVDEVHAMAISSPVCYTRAKRLIHEGNYAAAIPDLKIVEKARPKDPLVQVFIGSAYRNVGDLDLAEKHLAKALKLNAESVSALMESGMVMSQRGRLEEAIAFYRRAHARKPDHPEINIRLAFALARNHEDEEAILAFERASAVATLGAQEHLTWGFSLREAGSVEAGIEHFRESVKLAPLYADAHFHLGLALDLLGRSEEARDCYKRAVEINPDHVAAQELDKGGD